jgi:serine/threonine-protein kinase/endoribonuclease IRE1
MRNSGQCLKVEELIELLLQLIVNLKALHDKGYIHSDINPKSIKISIPDSNGKREAIIAGDFGDKKIQYRANTSSSNTEYRCWISPEALQSLKDGNNFEATKENDIFSLGCVIYFVLTRGKHPFSLNEESLLQNNYNLSELKDEKNQIFVHLIERMIQNEKSERPSIEIVLKHPMFWKPEKVLQFYTDIKNLFHAKNEKVMETPKFKNIQSKVKLDMKNKKSLVFGKNWLNKFCPVLKKYEENKIKNKDRYSIKGPDSYISLLDYIRNKDQHYDEWPEDIKRIFGSTVESYLDYFKQKFPLLLITTYDLLKVMKAERKLDSYY